MTRPIALVGAPSSIGIRPYDDGTIRRLDLAPQVLRAQGVASLVARDLGDVVPPPYRDLIRPSQRPRNEDGMAAYSHALGERVVAAGEAGSFALVIGGDCSIVLGCLLGARRADRSRVGLVYVDAHADFATPAESRTGSVASMCLALAVGRGDSPLAHLAGADPLVRPADAVVIGRRDLAEPWLGSDALESSPLLDLPHTAVRERGAAATAQAALDRVAQPGIDGFWIHLDADVIDPKLVPAVDSPEPGGLLIDELVDLLTPLVRHPKAIGLELTIYDPGLDPERSSAAQLTALLARVLDGNGRHANVDSDVRGTLAPVPQ